MAGVRVVLVEDNRLFRETLELLLGLREGIEVVGSVDGGAGGRRGLRRAPRPTWSLIDYRMPGLDGAQATAAVLAASPASARRLPDRLGLGTRSASSCSAAGAVACLTKDEDLDRIVDAILAAGTARREPDRREHGDRPRLDRRLPGGPGALPELADRAALRQLRRRELPRLRRSRRRTSSTRGSRAGRAADDLAADARRLPRGLRGARAAVRADLLAAALLDALGHVRERRGRRGARRARRCAWSTRARSRRRSRCSRSPCSGGSSAGTTDEEIDALVERYRATHGLLFTVDTLEYLARGGRIGRGAAFAGTLLNVKPILGIEDGEVVPLKRVRGSAEGARGARRARRGRRRPTRRRCGSGSRTRRRRSGSRRSSRSCARRGRRRRSRSSTALGAVVGTHAGPGTLGLFWFDDVSSDLSRVLYSEAGGDATRSHGLLGVVRDGEWPRPRGWAGPSGSTLPLETLPGVGADAREASCGRSASRRSATCSSGGRGATSRRRARSRSRSSGATRRWRSPASSSPSGCGGRGGG